MPSLFQVGFGKRWKMPAASLTSFLLFWMCMDNMLMFNCNIQVSDNGCTWVLSAAFARTFSTAIKNSKQHTTFWKQTASFLACFQNVACCFEYCYNHGKSSRKCYWHENIMMSSYFQNLLPNLMLCTPCSHYINVLCTNTVNSKNHANSVISQKF